MGIPQSHTVCPLKNLNNCLISIYFDNTADLFRVSGYGHFHDLIICRILNALQNHQRAIDLT